MPQAAREPLTDAPTRPVVCRDCKHAMLATGDQWDFAQCALTEHVDLVTGAATHTYCGAERVVGKCGQEGVNFEART